MVFLRAIALVFFLSACGDDDKSFDNPCDPKNAENDSDGDGQKNKDDLSPRGGVTCRRGNSAASLLESEGVREEVLHAFAGRSWVMRKIASEIIEHNGTTTWLFDQESEVCDRNATHCHIIWNHEGDQK